MSAGTITLTNGSAVVGGAGTSFATELAAGDFIVSTVGGVSYTLPVKSVESNTQLTLVSNFTGPTQSGAAWSAVPRVALNMVTAALVAQSAEALRGLNYDKQNWQQVYSAAGNITVKLPDGTTFTGPSWKYLSDNMATKSGGAVPVNQGGTGSTTAAGARGNLGISDKQLNSVDGKSGGNITSAVSSPGFIAGSSPTPSAQGHYFGWNEYGDGAAILQNNRGGGSGGFRFRTVNSTNTAEISVFHLAYTGVGYAPGGWQTGSDERIKEDIKDIDPDFALNAVLKLRHVTFKMRDRPDGEGGWVTGERSVGYIAQDLEQYLPDAVNTAESSEGLPGYRCRGDNNELLVVEGMKSIDPGKAGAALNGAAIKALYRIMNDENTNLRNEISELKEMIKELMDEPDAGNQ
ncbi:tail fiber domain-containing protein [Enterobacter asburiae]|uniref:tail fiber domain-containing protein n=1 Tax=Enterobacter asburiae TaxID=61645 RepID=UPI00192B73B5|nr:tail fiber domain-containing protein [Enterobacter asburiae]MBL5945480.1 tail fiber domain-containing protein [Enterobacter asburiae]MBL5953851.1 tail fiber domain-containing protein [Enterobacter asburiae]